MILLMFAWLSLGSAAPPEVVRGDDLVAWRALDEVEDPAALESFILDFPSSPLAQLAWERRLRLSPNPTTFRRGHRRLVRDLNRRLRDQRAQQDRTSAPQPPVVIADP